MKENNPVKISARLKELFFDYIVVLAYLVFLLIVVLAFYLLVLGGIPEFSGIPSQLVATFGSVIPIVVVFSFWITESHLVHLAREEQA